MIRLRNYLFIEHKMDAVREQYINKMREERLAREKSRIEKLREMNLKKYKKEEFPIPLTSRAAKPPTKVHKTTSEPTRNANSAQNPAKNSSSFATKPISNNRLTIYQIAKKTNDLAKPDITRNEQKVTKNPVKTTALTKNLIKKDVKPTKPTTVAKKLDVKNTQEIKTNVDNKPDLITNKDKTPETEIQNVEVKLDAQQNEICNSADDKTNVTMKKPFTGDRAVRNFDKLDTKQNDLKKVPTKMSRKTMVPTTEKPVEVKWARKSMLPAVTKSAGPKTAVTKAPPVSRKSFIPKVTQSASKLPQNKESVFDRLYKPKLVVEKPMNDIEKLQNDPKYRDKIIKQSGMIMNKRRTCFESKPVPKPAPVRRSISAVHFKRIGKNELTNCIHRWASIGENLDTEHLKDINEDNKVQQPIVSAVKSERKSVKFQTPMRFNFNTPKPSELQARLKNWLQKRGKSLSNYHHLQCFGLHHLEQTEKDFKAFDDENKENIALDSDSDNDSYGDNMNNKKEMDTKWRRASCMSSTDMDDTKWRRASCMSSTDMDDTKETIASEEVQMHDVDELLVGALNDLTQLLREGFDWEQCARWLRAIRERFPHASQTAQYWECRAALEEGQGNLPATLQCWQEAVANGTDKSVVEANLDHLLDKFMQLKISPNSSKRKEANPKMLDVKNVFKSTIIRFAVQQAKLRQSIQNEAKYIITPVRRSSRVSCVMSSNRKTPRTPLMQLCSSIKHIDSQLASDAKFVRNETLPDTP